MSAFLNSLMEEGTRDEYIYWIGHLCGEKRVKPSIGNLNNVPKDQLFRELVRLYKLEKV